MMAGVDWAAVRDVWDKVAGRLDDEERRPKRVVHTAVVWREIERRLADGAQTALDAGAGTGKYSIELARRGLQVTHLDLSPAMIEAAQAKAAPLSLKNITFVEGNICDLSRYPSRGFDLVISLDHPITLCGPDHARGVWELVRVTGKWLVLSVMNRMGSLPHFISHDVWCSRDLERPISFSTSEPLLASGECQRTEPVRAWEEKMRRSAGYPYGHGFTPAEIAGLVAASGLEVASVCAPGSLARLVAPDALEAIVSQPHALEAFLRLEEEYDRCPDVLGLGALTEAGLMVTGRRR